MFTLFRYYVFAMENTEPNTKQQIAARVDADVYAAIDGIAKDEERTLSNTIERLLKQSPQVAERLQHVESATV